MRTRLEETQNELSAWKFTPDSNTGKRLMAKCRQLYQENEELGKMTSSGRLAKLEGELALQKSFSEEVKKSQMELDEFVQELDEDVEGMQSTIYYLQQELRKSNDSVTALQLENAQLRSVRVNGTTAHSHSNLSSATGGASGIVATPTASANGRGDADSVCDAASRRTDSTSDSEPELIIKVSEMEVCDEGAGPSEEATPRPTAASPPTSVAEVPAPANNGTAKRGYRDDSDSSNQDIVPLHRTNRTAKKVRRSSVLSLDYNDDDALVISTNGDVAMSDAE